MIMHQISTMTGVAAFAAFGLSSASAIVIPTVPVGNVGNPVDTTGYGSVPYFYRVGTYEVTAGQYATFLNAVAQTDTNALYNPNMARTDYGSGISRSGSSGSYTYIVDAAFVNRPVNYVSFWDATRFANWLHNGQPTGVQDANTTENGAYTLTTTAIAANSVTRNAGWEWAVTSEHEWYKAAFHKGGHLHSGYWHYPTRSDTAPTNDLDDPTGNNANHLAVFGAVPIDPPYYTTLVGQYQNSGSAYGTFDQGGNVSEWNEAVALGTNRVVRGGAYTTDESNLRRTGRVNDLPTFEDRIRGFRVVQLPGPSSAVLLALGGVVAFRVGRRRQAIS